MKGTPAAEQVEAAVLARFGSKVTGIGQYNRRKIANSNTWSEHSWANGIDIHVQAKGATATPQGYVDGDAIYAWLALNKKALGIRTLLWRVKDHHNHIHADFWPRGRGVPPASSTGIGTFTYSDGRVASNKIQLIAPEKVVGTQPPPIGDEEVEAIKALQTALNAAGFKGANGKALTVDGLVGPNTAHALAQAFKAAASTPAPSSVDQVARTAAAKANNRLDNLAKI